MFLCFSFVHYVWFLVLSQLPELEMKPLLSSPGCGLCPMFLTQTESDLWLRNFSYSHVKENPLFILLDLSVSLCNGSSGSHSAALSVFVQESLCARFYPNALLSVEISAICLQLRSHFQQVSHIESLTEL